MPTVDIITLALISLHKDVKDYLEDNGWNRKISVYLSGDPILRSKKVVTEVNDTRNEIGLPIVVIDTTMVRSELEELGAAAGRDYVTLSIVVVALDDMQLRSLANMLRRRLDNYAFTIYDYSGVNTTSTVLSTASIEDVVLTDISDWNSPDIVEHYSNVLNATMELSSSSFI